MMDLSKKDRVEDAYKVKGILIKHSKYKQHFVIVQNNHWLSITSSKNKAKKIDGAI